MQCFVSFAAWYCNLFKKLGKLAERYFATEILCSYFGRADCWHFLKKRNFSLYQFTLSLSKRNSEILLLISSAIWMKLATTNFLPRNCSVTATNNCWLFDKKMNKLRYVFEKINNVKCEHQSFESAALPMAMHTARDPR